MMKNELISIRLHRLAKSNFWSYVVILYRKLPDNQSGQGHYFNSLRQENGMPMSTFDLVYRLPKSVTDAEIIKIAKLHLAGNEGSEIGHTIK